jgi:hypothetical protein
MSDACTGGMASASTGGMAIASTGGMASGPAAGGRPLDGGLGLGYLSVAEVGE